MDWVPGKPEEGKRVYQLISDDDNNLKLYISKDDLDLIESSTTRSAPIRLKDLANIVPTYVNRENKIIKAKFHSFDLIPGIKKIHWVPTEDLSIDAKILMPDGTVKKGLVEFMAQQLKNGEYVQFERMGFGRVDRNEGELIIFTFAHS